MQMEGKLAAARTCYSCSNITERPKVIRKDDVSSIADGRNTSMKTKLMESLRSERFYSGTCSHTPRQHF